MEINTYVGIDVSKLSLDVFIRENRSHRVFPNNVSGFEAIVTWIKKLTGQSTESMLMCFEHTGLYSMQLAIFLEQKHILFSMVPALEIKKSMGITRGKSDMVDSRRIAEFAFRFRDKLSFMQLPSADIRKLHLMLSLRGRLSVNLGGYKMTINEIRKTLPKDNFDDLFATYNAMINSTKDEIIKLEQAIKTIIRSNTQLRTSFELITTIKGIGLIIATYLIVYTCNFTRFSDWRKFACYSGTAPFEYRSGTSIQGRTRVSSIANQQMKRLLHMAALCAIHSDVELREYYHRRCAEGKHKMLIVNILRNKIIARVFAVVKRGTPFVDIKRYVS